MNHDVDKRASKESEPHACKSVFIDKNLSLHTKCEVCQARVVSVPLYGSEVLDPSQNTAQETRLHHRCIHTLLGISNKMRQKWISKEIDVNRKGPEGCRDTRR